MKPLESHMKSCQLKNWAKFFPYSLGSLKNMNFGLIFPHRHNMQFWKMLIWPNSPNFHSGNFYFIHVSRHARKMRCCGLNLFWDGCNEIQIFGSSDHRPKRDEWVIHLLMIMLNDDFQIFRRLPEGEGLFEPTCANARWALMPRFLSVCLSVRKKD